MTPEGHVGASRAPTDYGKPEEMKNAPATRLLRMPLTMFLLILG